jgi:hypothetical protein
MSKHTALPIIGFLAFHLLAPEIAAASVESTLAAMQSKLISTILPLCAILGLVWAAFSFFMGNANARSHVILAIIGACVGFGAPSIVAFIRGLVH